MKYGQDGAQWTAYQTIRKTAAISADKIKEVAPRTLPNENEFDVQNYSQMSFEQSRYYYSCF